MKTKTRKLCNDCRINKSISKFPKRTGKQSKWRGAFCNACMCLRMNEWRERNRERFNKYQRDYIRIHKK